MILTMPKSFFNKTKKCLNRIKQKKNNRTTKEKQKNNKKTIQIILVSIYFSEFEIFSNI